MRVIGGSLKGRRLASFRGRSVRPTSDKVREAVFNILHRPGPSTRVLDLFAGTGAMGIEALSRGAAEAVFVDIDSASIATVRKNLQSCGVLDRSKVYKMDAVRAVRELAARSEGFDLIFIDPPYESGLTEKALEAIAAVRLLSPGGVIVAETSRRSALEGPFDGLDVVDERRYGDTVVYFLAPDEG